MGGDASCDVRFSRYTLRGISPYYASVPRGEPLAVPSSFGTLEIACNRDRADRLLGLKRGDPVIVEKRGRNGRSH